MKARALVAQHLHWFYGIKQWTVHFNYCYSIGGINCAHFTKTREKPIYKMRHCASERAEKARMQCTREFICLEYIRWLNCVRNCLRFSLNFSGAVERIWAQLCQVLTVVSTLTRNNRKMFATIIDTTLNEAPMTPATGLCGRNIGGLPFWHLYSDMSCRPSMWKSIARRKCSCNSIPIVPRTVPVKRRRRWQRGAATHQRWQ